MLLPKIGRTLQASSIQSSNSVCGDVGREVIRLTHFQGQSQGQGPYLLLTPYTHGVPHVDCEGPCAVIVIRRVQFVFERPVLQCQHNSVHHWHHMARVPPLNPTCTSPRQQPMRHLQQAANMTPPHPQHKKAATGLGQTTHCAAMQTRHQSDISRTQQHPKEPVLLLSCGAAKASNSSAGHPGFERTSL
jgi:hypothetical protein